MKKAKLLTLKNIIDKKSPPAYIKIDGHVYEKLEGKTVSVDVDLDADVIKTLETQFKKGGYVNTQELIRDALRTAMNTGALK